ncbi:MAG: hypothetical protein AMXMBFR84_37570 [Candidatus Hydrogenedentota bacterium]
MNTGLTMECIEGLQEAIDANLERVAQDAVGQRSWLEKPRVVEVKILVLPSERIIQGEIVKQVGVTFSVGSKIPGDSSGGQIGLVMPGGQIVLRPSRIKGDPNQLDVEEYEQAVQAVADVQTESIAEPDEGSPGNVSRFGKAKTGQA